MYIKKKGGYILESMFTDVFNKRHEDYSNTQIVIKNKKIKKNHLKKINDEIYKMHFIH